MRDHDGVTKIDEAARVPAVDAAARARLRGALDRDGIVAAALIGSQATGRAGPLSDIDVGVWLDPSLDAADRARCQVAVTGAAIDALGTDEVDVVVLNDASPAVRHRAMLDRVPLIVRDDLARVRLEADAAIEYLDTARLRAEQAPGILRRLKAGAHGGR